jgi:AraC-like DNA-binding protein
MNNDTAILGNLNYSCNLLFLDSNRSDIRSPGPILNQFPYWVFSYCFGEGGEIVFIKNNKSFHSRHGHVSIVPADTLYKARLMQNENNIYHWIQVKFEFCHFLDPLFYLDLPDVLSKELSEKILQIGERIIEVKQDEDMSEINKAVEFNYAGILLLKLLCSNFQWKPFPDFNSKEFNSLQAAVAAMKINTAKRFSIEQLASSASMSIATFYRYFKRTFKTTPAAYLEKLRRGDAVDLLCIKGYSIGETANKLNYCDQFQFSRAFKKFYGQSPSQYRDNYKHGVFQYFKNKPV